MALISQTEEMETLEYNILKLTGVYMCIYTVI